MRQAAVLHTAESRCVSHTKLGRSTHVGCRPHVPRVQSIIPTQSRTAPCAAADSDKVVIWTVGDVMTAGRIVSCSPDTTVDEALEMLVEFRITGLPVIDEDSNVVGVVSDYDLLALDTLGRTNDDNNLFPVAEQTWQAFKEVKSLLAKSGGKRVKDVMTKTPIMVREKTDIDDAARILLSKKIRRLPVVDENGKLCGIISRSNLVKAALSYRKAAAQQ